MKLKRLFIIGLLFSTGLLLKAQTDFRPGYIINASGDTINGEIDYRGDLLMSSICKFKDVDNTISKYSPNDIKAYRFIDSKYYVSKKIENNQVFLEILIKGLISIYYLRDDNGDRYFIEKDSVGFTEITYSEKIITVDAKRVFLPNNPVSAQLKVKKIKPSNKHNGIFIFYMQDAPQLQSEINNMKIPERYSMIKLAEDYHNAVCKGEKCIIYEKVQPILKVNLEMVGGVINFENMEDLNDKFYFQGGVIANFWMPRSNEKIYFKTGLLYSQVEKDGVKENYIKIPTHIGYLAPNTFRIRPSISIGLLSPSYSAGLMVKVNKRINLGIQSWVNFYTDGIPWIPSKLNNYSILGNLYIEL